jgi:hypothetical protein
LFWGLGLARLVDGHRRLRTAKDNFKNGIEG